MRGSRDVWTKPATGAACAVVGASVLAALLLAGSARTATLLPVQKGALRALAKARAAGHVDAASAAADRREIGRAAYLVRRLPGRRGGPIAACLGQIGALTGKLTAARATAVFGQLRANDDWFARRPAPPAKTDVTDADGIVYRYFPGRCFEFHPLANFGALNADVAAGKTDAAAQLARALIERAVPQAHGGLGWEYYFDFDGGRAPWLSGLAQAVAAQALARAGAAGDPALLHAASAAYRTIPGRLLTSVAAEPWIRLYAFSSLAVLNAQLQAAISLQSYAQSAGDKTAAALAARLQTAVAVSLPRFDSGFWSDYSLAGDPSPLDYQQYVAQLLRTLAKTDQRFAAAAMRFTSYLTQPPAFKLANAPVGATRFWVSKPSTVEVQSAAGPTRRLSVDGGWHTVSWKLPKRAGVYPVRISASDWAGNSAAVDALPIVRAAVDTTATNVTRSTRATPAPLVAGPSFAVGAGLDDPSQGALAKQLGLATVRLGIAWPAGATSLDPGVATALKRLPPTENVVVELIADPLPADDAGRSALASYAVSLAQQLPTLRDVVLEPAVTPASAPAEAAALGVIRQQLQQLAPAVALGAALDGAQDPQSALTALGAGAVATGLESVLDVIAFRPAPAAGPTAWTLAGLPQLESALGLAFDSAPPILIDGLAVPTAIPAGKLSAYNPAPPAGGATEAAQAAAYSTALADAACNPAVAGVLLDRLVDSPSVPPTSGIFYADGTPKSGTAAVGSVALDAQRGRLVCPGLEMPATATGLAFPTGLSASQATGVTFGCARDCLYLVTLEKADGTPVVARRGALAGGADPQFVGLPRAPLAGGGYQLDLRLIAQTNPGTVETFTSPQLSVQ